MIASFRIEDIPYDAMGDYSAFNLERPEEEAACVNRGGRMINHPGKASERTCKAESSVFRTPGIKKRRL